MNDTLEHIGILGMHWGHRKSRNTANTSSEDHSISRSIKTKKLHEMNNKEIQTYLNRVNLERQYKEVNPNKVTRAKKSVNNVLGSMSQIVAAAGTLTAVAALGKKIFDYYTRSEAGKRAMRKGSAALSKRLASVL
jgi:hypothetical protein